MIKAIVVLMLICAPVMSMTASEYEELKVWLASDATDHNQYIEGKFDCTAFAARLSINATEAGYPVMVAYINAEKYPEGHAVNVVEVDGGYKFIEPQADIEVELENATITIDDPMQDNPREFVYGKNKIVLSGNVLQKVMN